jgi:hypothetical protein
LIIKGALSKKYMTKKLVSFGDNGVVVFQAFVVG